MMARLALWLSLALALFLAACSTEETRAQLTEGCSLNSDCAPPLVCAFRRCHVACTESRDCKPGQRCVAGDRPFHVCQLDEERNCQNNTECATGQACGSDGQCRDRCRADTDCVTGQTCVRGACAERADVDGGAIASRDASADASSGGACLYNSQCDAPLVCKNRVCGFECLAASDCAPGLDCVNTRCVGGSGTLLGLEGGVVSAFDGKVTLTVPKGALRSPTTIAIAAVEQWPAGALGRVFAIEPSGLQFDLGVTLAYRYEQDELAGAAPERLRLGNAVGPRWLPLGSQVDVARRTVSAELVHLSVYGLLDPSVPSPSDAGVDAWVDSGPTCADSACSGAAADGCCPPACNASNDVDCAGCGNGHLDPGETCDPLQTCPSRCAPVGCQRYAVAMAGTCQATCVASDVQTACVNADGCCPAGCNSSTDSDCPVVCGNGIVEPGELCDGNCPSKCSPVGCEQQQLQGTAATCDAHCAAVAVQTACVAGDGCCPSTCNARTDADCIPSCGNGVVENNELCDGNCPASCPAMGCQLRAIKGSSLTCDAQCVNAGTRTTCANNDGCCPAGCTTLNDSDCKAACGNGVVEAGETCDPATACVAAQGNCVNDANNVVTTSGSTTACTFTCTKKQRSCGPADSFCPSGVACGPTTDVDCPGCGNGRIETGESCDPVSACAAQAGACVSDATNVRTASGSTANCTFRCTTTARACGPADGFCPPSCGPKVDVDCAGCGNGRVETALGETCDVAPASPTCLTTCNDGDACTTDSTSGAPATCNVVCAHKAVTACVKGDGCCPAGCNAANDADCSAVCGNGILEGAETCEVAPASPLCSSINCNDGDACTADSTRGSSAACNLACAHTAITLCVSGDGCCPGGGRGACNANNDSDCAAVCGNGVIEGKETCEVAPASPVCAATCDDGRACTTDTASGSSATCNLLCTHTAITACAKGDGCCPAGCNSLTDGDCPAACGNGLVEATETCDTGLRASCPASCAATGCVLPDLVNPGTCTASCVDQGKRQTACTDRDGCCPPGCTDYSDSDCPTPNDLCAQATDISAGGDFTFSLLNAGAEVAPAKCTLNQGPEVFFQFKLPAASAVYFDVYDPGGNAVNVELELYAGGCPGPNAPFITCDAVNGTRGCADKVAWPRIFLANLDPNVYVLAARSTGLLGRYTLRFHRIPVACLGSALVTESNTTCSQQDLVRPTCAAGGQDRTYYVEKCPTTGLSLDTCSRITGKSDTIVVVNEGSIDLVNGVCVLAPSAKAIDCQDDDPTCTAASTLASRVTNVGRGEHGLFTIGVDSDAKAGCGPYGLTSTILP